MTDTRKDLVDADIFQSQYLKLENLSELSVQAGRGDGGKLGGTRRARHARPRDRTHGVPRERQDDLAQPHLDGNARH